MPTIEPRGPFDCAEAGKKQVRQIASSIQRFGFTNPVLQDLRRTIIVDRHQT
jgi:hypothetical protein